MRFIFQVTKVEPAEPIPVCGGRGHVVAVNVTLDAVDTPTDTDPDSKDGPCLNADVWMDAVPLSTLTLHRAVLGEVGELSPGRRVELVLRPV